MTPHHDIDDRPSQKTGPGDRGDAPAILSRLTIAGGILAICAGIGHTITAAVMRRDVWAHIVDRGFAGTISLEPSAEQLAATEAFWFSPGSFGVPLTLLGFLVVWSVRQGHRVPGLVGWGLVAWALLVAALGGLDVGSALLTCTGVLIGVGGIRPRTPSSGS